MTKAKARLPFVSLQGPDPEFPLDDADFNEFEAIVGGQISQPARDELQAICDRYLYNRTTDASWQTYDDVLKHFGEIERTAKALWAFAYDGGIPTDARSQLQSIFEDNLKAYPVRLVPEDGDLLLHDQAEKRWRRFDEFYAVPEGAYAIEFTFAFLRNFAMNFRVAADRTLREIEALNAAPSDSLRIGADDVFLLEVRKWAKSHDFRYSEYRDGREPAPLAIFAAALLNRTPVEWQLSNRDTTPAAVAMQIKRARQALKERNKKGAKK